MLQQTFDFYLSKKIRLGVCLAENSHEISSLIFSENKEKTYSRLLSAAVVIES